MLSIPRIGLNKSFVANAQRSCCPTGGDKKAAGLTSDVARTNGRTPLVLRTKQYAGTRRAASRFVPPPRVREGRLARRRCHWRFAGRAPSHRAAPRPARPPPARCRRPGANNRCPRPPAPPLPRPLPTGNGHRPFEPLVDWPAPWPGQAGGRGGGAPRPCRAARGRCRRAKPDPRPRRFFCFFVLCFFVGVFVLLLVVCFLLCVFWL